MINDINMPKDYIECHCYLPVQKYSGLA